MANYITNPFSPYDSNNTAVPGFKWNDTLGGTPTYTDPKTGVERKLGWGPTGPEGDYTYDETGQANPISGQQMGYGFLDENPWLSPNSATFIANPHPADSGTGFLNKVFGTGAALLGGAIGLGAGAGAGAGGAAADSGMAFGGESALQGSSYLGGAEAATGGGMGAGADAYGNFDFGNGLTGTTTAANPPALTADVLSKVNQIPGGSTMLSRIMNGTATSDDYLSAAGKAVATALGIYGSNQQSKAYTDLANKYDTFGAPSRARYEAAMSSGFNPNSIPGYSGAVDSASKSILSRLSATGGNPFGNPQGLVEANKSIISGTALPAIQSYINSNASTGFGAPMGATLNLQNQAIGSDANAYNAAGYGLNQLTAPTSPTDELIRAILSGYKQNTAL